MKNKMNFEKLRRIIISSIVIAMIILVIWDVKTAVTMTLHTDSKTLLYSLLKFTILSTIIFYAVIIPAADEFYSYESICDFIALKFVPRKVYSNKNLYYEWLYLQIFQPRIYVATYIMKWMLNHSKNI